MSRVLDPQVLSAMPDEALLHSRMREVAYPLGEHVSFVADAVRQLRRDLLRARLRYLQPTIYVGDEWFSPDRMVAIAVPFYLGHRRLMSLERTQMGEVEGGGPRSCLRLLRHEAGHCFDHAYAISERADFKRIFGDVSSYNPDAYPFNPQDRDFVVHLGEHYAQSHPFEDFAECFAVLISPEIAWQRLYAARPKVLAKLNYTKELMIRFADKRPQALSGTLPFAAERMTKTLDRHYEQRARLAGKRHFAFFDAQLRRLFGAQGGKVPASEFLRIHEPQLTHRCSSLTDTPLASAKQLLKRLAMRCEQLNLKVRVTREALKNVERLMVDSLNLEGLALDRLKSDSLTSDKTLRTRPSSSGSAVWGKENSKS